MHQKDALRGSNYSPPKHLTDKIDVSLTIHVPGAKTNNKQTDMKNKKQEKSKTNKKTKHESRMATT